MAFVAAFVTAIFTFLFRLRPIATSRPVFTRSKH